jgi:hypothetical protein
LVPRTLDDAGPPTPRVRSMSATRINRWVIVSNEPAPRVRELGVSAAVTAALFAAALAAMTTLRAVNLSHDTTREGRVTWVLVPVPTPVRTVAPPRVSRVAAPRQVPTSVESVRAPADVTPATSTTPPVHADTTTRSAAPSSPAIPLSIVPPPTLPYVPHTAIGGAPISTAAVTALRAPLTAARRDSLAAASMADVPYLATQVKLTPEEEERLARQRQPVPSLPTGRSQPTIGIGMSIPFPVFEPGPSAAQRKRDAIVAAENQARLYRLEDRLFQKRDSIRLDSLRRDSVAMKRKPVSTPPS